MPRKTIYEWQLPKPANPNNDVYLNGGKWVAGRYGFKLAESHPMFGCHSKTGEELMMFDEREQVVSLFLLSCKEKLMEINDATQKGCIVLYLAKEKRCELKEFSQFLRASKSAGGVWKKRAIDRLGEEQALQEGTRLLRLIEREAWEKVRAKFPGYQWEEIQ